MVAAATVDHGTGCNWAGTQNEAVGLAIVNRSFG